MLKFYDYIFYRFRCFFEKTGKADPRAKACGALSIVEMSIFLNIPNSFSVLPYFHFKGFSFMIFVISLFLLNLLRYYNFYKQNKWEQIWSNENKKSRFWKGFFICSVSILLVVFIPVGIVMQNKL
jgi:hypothetical protein